MEPDGKTRVWHNMQDPEMYGGDGVCEEYPVLRDFERSIYGEEAEQIRSEADVAFRVDREPNPEPGAYPRYLYWADVRIMATGELIRLDGFRLSDGSTAISRRVVNEMERHLGKTGLTIISGGGFGFSDTTQPGA